MEAEFPYKPTLAATWDCRKCTKLGCTEFDFESSDFLKQLFGGGIVKNGFCQHYNVASPVPQILSLGPYTFTTV